MKKALFLSFYWPPSGKASMHWPLKMVKHLPKYGWQPSVLTVQEDTFTASDTSMLKDIDPGLEVVRTGFLDPFSVYRKLTGKKEGEPLVASEAMSTENKSLGHRLSLWVRLNLFIPDARVGWYFPGIKEARKYLGNNKIDAIVSNGPPHTTHLLGKKLAKEFGVPLVSVFIDPWVDISYYKGLTRNKLTLAIDNHLEKSVIKASDRLIFVTRELEKYFLEKYPFIEGKTDVLYWGYNEEEFEGIKNCRDNKTAKEEIFLHAGNIFDHQNPPGLWKTLKKEIDSGRNIKIRFIGTVSPLIKNEIKSAGLEPHTEYKGFLPYNEVIKEMCAASWLLVCATEPRHIPGKLFEYMRTGNPVIAFADNNTEVKSILDSTGAGIMYGYSDTPRDFFTRAESLSPDISAARRYSRETIAEKLASVLRRI